MNGSESPITEDLFEASSKRFCIPENEGRPLHYFCGNSLGLQPKTTSAAISEVLQDWAGLAVDAHFDAGRRWYDYPDLLSPGLARLCGASESEVRAMGSLSSNLHLMMVSFFQPKGKRRKILIEAGAFPSDRYAVESQLKFHGLDPKECLIEVFPRKDSFLIETEDILSAITDHEEELALVLFSGVQFRSGQCFDMAAIAAAAQASGARCGFDLAHAIGNVPLQLHAWGADFAVWCSYKYLNAGPGAVGGIFVHEKHASDESLPRFAGWFGQKGERRFLMESHFSPAYGAEGWQLSNENILSLAALRASLEEFKRFDFSVLVARQQQLVSRMEALLREIPGMKILTGPERGGQLSFQVKNNPQEFFARLKSAGITGDYRKPDVIRLAIAPLYNRKADLDVLEACLMQYC
jgi:kynureninase